MNLQDLENILREEGAQDLPKVDTEQLWQRVEPHIPKKERRIGLFNLRFLFGLIFLTVITTGFIFNFYSSEKMNNNELEYYTNGQSLVESSRSTSTATSTATSTSNTNNNTNVISNEAEELTTKINPQIPIEKYKNVRTVNNELDNEEILSDVSSKRVDPINHTVSHLIAGELIESKSEHELVLVREQVGAEVKTIVVGDQKEIVTAKQAIQTENKLISTDKKDNPLTKNIQRNTLSNNALTTNNVYEDNQKDLYNNVVRQNSYSVTERLDNKNFAPTNTNKNLSDNNDLVSKSQIYLDKKLENISSRYLSSVPSLLNDEFLISPTLVSNPRKNSKRWMLSLGAGSFIASKSFQLNATRLQEDFDSRGVSESILDAWNTSLAVSYNLSPKLRLSLGVDYSWINEQSEKTIISQELIELPEVVVAQIITGNSVENVVANNVSVNRITERKIRRINTYKWIDVPIEMIYASQLSRNLSLDVGVGFSKNIALRASGFWHPDHTQEYGLDLDENQYLKSNTGFSLMGHVGLRYELSNKFGIFSRVRVKNQFSPITNSTYGIDQSYRLVGVEAGLISKF